MPVGGYQKTCPLRAAHSLCGLLRYVSQEMHGHLHAAFPCALPPDSNCEGGAASSPRCLGFSTTMGRAFTCELKWALSLLTCFSRSILSQQPQRSKDLSLTVKATCSHKPKPPKLTIEKHCSQAQEVSDLAWGLCVSDTYYTLPKIIKHLPQWYAINSQKSKCYSIFSNVQKKKKSFSEFSSNTINCFDPSSELSSGVMHEEA